MSFASKHFDPVLGIDVHILLIVGVPTPLPNPFIGILFDPMDYLPVLGATVNVNGVPRAQAGSSGMTVIPHLPLGGPFVKPLANEAEVFMGSSTVCVDGDAFGYGELPALSCNDIGILPPFRLRKKKKTISLVLPTSLVISFPWGNPVNVGGSPTISLMALGMRAGMAVLGKAFRKLRKLQKKSAGWARLSAKMKAAADKLMDKLGISQASKLRNKVDNAICTVTGHPVDVATGKVFTTALDFELTGLLPLRWERIWFSTSTYRGPLGHGMHHAYDLALLADADAIAVRLADGRGVAFPPLQGGESYFLRAEHLTLRREEKGYVLTDARGQSAHFRSVGRSNRQIMVTELAGASGGVLRFSYDASGQLRCIRSSSGARIDLELDAEGRIAGIFLHDRNRPGERTVLMTYTYDAEGDLVCVRDALNQPFSYGYDGHLLVKETNRDGDSYWFEYDAKGPLARCVQTRGDGGLFTRRLDYAPEQRTTRVEDGEGNVTLHKYNEFGLVVRTVDPLGGVELFSWSEDNELESETDRAGRTTVYQTDDEGRLSEIRHPEGRIVRVEHDASGRVLSLVDDHGEIWERIPWEGDGEVGTEYRHPAYGCAWYYELDGRGIPVRRLGVQLEPIPANPLEFQFGGLLPIDQIGIPDEDDELVVDGEVLTPVALDRPEEQNEYDALGRPIRTVDAFGHTVRRKFSPEGRLRAYQDRDVGVWTYVENRASRARRETDPTGKTTVFGFSSEGLLSEITDPGGTVHHYAHNARGEQVGILRDGLACTRFLRSKDGSTLTVQDGHGLPLRSTEYDGKSLRKVERYASGSEWRFSYDRLGRYQRIESNEHKLAFAYDGAGRRVLDARDGAGIERVFKEGRLSELTILDRFRIQYAYGRDGGVSIVGPSGASTWVHLTEFGLVQREMPSGSAERVHFDARGRRLSRIRRSGNGEESGEERYRYSPEGRLQAVVGDEGSTIFEHDGAGRLRAATSADGSRQTFAYDAAGNLLEQPGMRAVVGKSNQLVQVNGDTLVHDERGRLIGRDGPTVHAAYTYDERDLLVEVTIGHDRWTARYDPMGRRIQKTWRGRVTSYFWDQDKLAAEIDPEGRLRLYVYAHADALVPLMFVEYESQEADPDSGKVYFVFTDQCGAPIRVEDWKGQCVWSAVLSPYGQAVVAEGAKLSMPLRFPGHYHDEEIGLFYNRWRYYSPETGRYLQPDPLDTSGSLNLYAYPADPLTEVDLFGLTGHGLSSGSMTCGGKTTKLRGDRVGRKDQRREINKTTEQNLETGQRIKSTEPIRDAAAAFKDKTDGSVKYKTDSKGRPVLSVGNLVRKPGKRGETPMPAMGEGSLIKGVDDKGHLSAVQLIGTPADERKNVVPENSVVNQMHKRGFEDAMRAYKKANPTAKVTTISQAHYKDNDPRPNRISHYGAVNGKVVTAVHFDNPKDISMRSNPTEKRGTKRVWGATNPSPTTDPPPKRQKNLGRF